MCVTLMSARVGPAAVEAITAVLPRLEAVAPFATSRVPCPDACDELATEAVALAWLSHLALVRRVENPAAFVTTLARRATLAALAGRRGCGAEKRRDALSRSPASEAA